MKKIQHYVFALILVFLLWWIAGLQSAVWVAAAFFAYLSIKSLGGKILESARIIPNRALRTVEYENIWTFRIGSILIWGSLGIVILATILLFQNFDWITAVGLVILVVGFAFLKSEI